MLQALYISHILFYIAVYNSFKFPTVINLIYTLIAVQSNPIDEKNMNKYIIRGYIGLSRF